MFKKIVLNFAFLFSIFASLLAPSYASNIDDERYACNTHARAGYIHTDVGNSPAEQAFAVGGRFLCDISITDVISLNAALHTSIDPGINNNNDQKLHGDFFNDDKDSYIMLGEFAFNMQLAGIEANLGRQVFYSPHMDSDHLRMVPNLFEAYQANYEINDSTSIGAAYISRMAGWENGNDQAHFVDIDQAFGGNGEGAYALWANFEASNISLQTWAYHVTDIENIFYAEIAFSDEINNTISYELALQYDVGRETGNESLGNIDANTWGLISVISYGNTTFSAAYNKNSGDNGALASLGGGPFFTSMEDQTLDAVTGSDARAFVLALEHQITETVLTGIAVADFEANDKSDYDVQEIDTYVSYELDQQLSVEAIYASIQDQNSPDDTSQFRVIMTYHYF